MSKRDELLDLLLGKGEYRIPKQLTSARLFNYFEDTYNKNRDNDEEIATGIRNFVIMAMLILFSEEEKTATLIAEAIKGSLFGDEKSRKNFKEQCDDDMFAALIALTMSAQKALKMAKDKELV